MPQPWAEALDPTTAQEALLFAQLQKIRFKDGTLDVNPSRVDMLSLGLVARVLCDPDLNLAVLLPRGDHEFAVFCGLYAHLWKVVSRNLTPAQSNIAGPIVIVGMNTQVHRRFRSLRMSGYSLGSVLDVCRLRSDGRAATASGSAIKLSRDTGDLILYLNSRVGWPSITRKAAPGVVIIDQTSFKSHDAVRRALAWASANRAQTVIIVADSGDLATLETISTDQRNFLVWEWSPQLTAQVNGPALPPGPYSSLTTNALLAPCQGAENRTEATICEAADVDKLFRQVLARISKARKIDHEMPPPLVLARRLVNGLLRCVGSLDHFNREAALDHRTASLGSLASRLESTSPTALTGKWAGFAETGWAELKFDILTLYKRVEDENPKLLGLILLLEELTRGKATGDPIVVRVGSNAAKFALASDLREYEFVLEPDKLRLATVSERLPWATQPLLEVYPGALPPWHTSVITSGESTRRIHLLYPFEVSSLARTMAREYARQAASVQSAAKRIGMTTPPAVTLVAASVPTPFSFNLQRDESPHTALPSVDVNMELLFDEIPDPERAAADHLPPDAQKELVLAIPVSLHPAERWWVRESARIETFRREIPQSLNVSDLRPGDRIIVPRGEAREALFDRVVAALHERSSQRAFQEILRRWRRACWELYRQSGENWRNAEKLLRAEGSTVTWQSPRMWARGDVIVPGDSADIQRVGKIVADEFLERQSARVYEMGREIRRLHRRIGKLLTAAWAEAADGGGPNLERLTQVLGVAADDSEILDEFQLRTVDAVGEAREIPAHRVGSIEGA